MVRVFSAVARLASSRANLLLEGEPGTGKRTIARRLHQHGARSSDPFVEFSCAALPEPLLESELFGHEQGAFPWAISRRRGRLERAHGGTLFLDHVDKLPPRLQMRLQQSLAEGAVEHAGGGQPIPVSVRIVAAAASDLQDLTDQGRFLPDLREMIAVVTLTLPALRDRPQDVLLLATHFAAQAAERHGRAVTGIARETARKIETHDWPGNLLELRSAMEQAVLLTDGPVIQPEALPDSVRWPGGAGLAGGVREDLQVQASLEEVEAAHIRRVLRATAGNSSRAAEILGIHRNTLRRKLRQYGIPD
jgi:two-component system response regulator HydG